MQLARTRTRWQRQDLALTDAHAARAELLVKAMGVHPVVAQLLVMRGLGEAGAAQGFLSPKLTDLHDPALLFGAEQAAERICRAIATGQPIVIYGDYDVDGVTASAILYHTLTACGGKVETYVPHRLDEGYGLNEAAIRALGGAHGDDKPVIVSVDCGITATGPAKCAKELGIDLIITDHHHFDADDLPEALALVHPKLAGEGDQPYPCEHLCGAGVAFKLAWQIARAHCGSDRLPAKLRDLLVDLLSYVALGTVADVVPLVGENRILTTFGLGRIKQTRFEGLNAMIAAARLGDEKIDAYHIGFVLGPRLNACGRMGHAREAVRLLTTATGKEAADLADFLTKENDRRRATERAIFDQAKEMVTAAGYDRDTQRAIVLAREGWHPGVVGIVASRLVEAFHRPVVMLSVEEGTAKGSARSVDAISIHQAFFACSSHLEKFGGHAMAAGLTLASENVDAFRSDLVAWINERLSAEELIGSMTVDATVALAACTVDLFDQIHKLAPFGRGNPTPRLLMENVQLDRPAQRIGKTGDHLSLMLRSEGKILRAVAFGMGEMAEQLPAGVHVDVLFQPKVSVWQGMRRAEVHVKDLQII